MKNKIWIALLSIEAVLCAVFWVTKASVLSAFTSVMAFPFEQIGMGFRTLSLSGTAGNIVAIVLYAALSLVPLAVLLWRGLKKRLFGGDALLVLLSALLFPVLYLMVNPGDMGLFGGAAGIPAGKVVLGGTVYSVLCGYIVLRVLRLFFNSGTEKLQKYLRLMVYLLSVIFVYAIFFACFGGLLDAIKALQAGNQGSEQTLGTSYVFLVLQFIVNAVPYAMDIWIVFAAGRLLSDIQADRYSQAAVVSADRLSRYCKISLMVTILTQIFFNMLQLIFAGNLRVINSQIQLPVLSAMFVLAVLLLSRYLAESKRLKDENDMFV